MIILINTVIYYSLTLTIVVFKYNTIFTDVGDGTSLTLTIVVFKFATNRGTKSYKKCLTLTIVVFK